VTASERDIARLAAAYDMSVVKLRSGGYWLFDNYSNRLVLGSECGWSKTGVSLETIRLHLEGIRR
jgi:hypothetical protein